MKLSLLKLNKVRKTFKVVVDDIEEEIVVYNIMDEPRNKIVDKLLNVEEGNEENLGKEIYETLFKECTNLEIDCDIDEILDNPRDVASLIIMELHEILHEIQLETVATKMLQLNDLENRMKAVLLEEKTSRIQEVLEDIKAIRKENDNGEDEESIDDIEED